MKNFTKAKLDKIEAQIQKIEHNEKDKLKCVIAILKFLDCELSELKDFIINYEFKSEEEEILFFREIKPKIWSKLIFYMSVYKIEINRPKGSVFTIESYFSGELDRIKHFFDRNIEMYHYYRTGSTHFDKTYFLRNRETDIPVNLACFYYERDVRFSTGYDYKIAKIIANDFIQLYINSELFKLKMEVESVAMDSSLLLSPEKWTATKTDLAELIYAFDTIRCINHGNTKLNALTTFIEKVFNIDIGDIYRIYLELRERKGSRTQFIDRLRDGLIKRMDEADINGK